METKEFAQQIRDALQNLHDFAALQKLPLAMQWGGVDQSLDQSVRQLRADLITAIEQLNPPGKLPTRAKERRPYAILYGRFVQGLTTAELCEELAISVRQFRREHARALHAITDLMWNRRIAKSAEADSPGAYGLPIEPSSQVTAQVEADQLIHQARMEDLSLPGLINDLVATLLPAAAQKGIALENRLIGDRPRIQANRVVLRQGIAELISFALRRLSAGKIILEIDPAKEAAIIIRTDGEMHRSERPHAGFDISEKLIGSLGGRTEILESAEGWQACITLPSSEDQPILVMDDNAGLIELFRRYLAGGRYRVLEAHTAEEAIQIARQHLLRLILLDVMMPEQDGWEILERLRSAPETRPVPIVICSVINEPEIAFSLGASDYLTKPVTHVSLLEKVEYWCGVQP